MPVSLITDGYTATEKVIPALGGPPLTITFRPATRLELVEHMKNLEMKKGQEIEQEKIQIAFVASRIKNWDVAGDPQVNADNVGRLPPGYLDQIENLITGRKVTDDEKKS